MITAKGGVFMNLARDSFKKIRNDRKLTQRKLSELSGVTETTIRNIENSRSNPSFELAITLSKIMQCNFEKLWADDFSKKS